MTAPDVPTSLIPGTVVGRGEAGAAVDVGGVILHVRGSAPPPGSAVVLGVLADALRLNPRDGLENMIRARVAAVHDAGGFVLYELEVPGGITLRARERPTDREGRLAVGDRVRVGWEAARTAIMGGQPP